MEVVPRVMVVVGVLVIVIGTLVIVGDDKAVVRRGVVIGTEVVVVDREDVAEGRVVEVSVVLVPVVAFKHAENKMMRCTFSCIFWICIN